MNRLLLASFTCAVIWGIASVAQATEQTPEKASISFGSLETQKADAVQARAEAWLKEVGKADPATLAKVAAIWKQEDRAILDRLGDTFALGNADAAKLMAQAQDPSAPAPTKVPELFKDEKQSQFFKANLALTYARALSQRRVHEESLAVLALFQPEQVVDPAAYLFHRAVAEHELLQKVDATRSIDRLLDDVIGSPERYRTVSTLMLLDMYTWKDKDLGAIARKMDNIERRLELARGGPQTQKLQKEVVSRLDELIKELENQAKNQSGNGGACPPGGQPTPGNGGGPNTNAPMQDSTIANNGGNGTVDPAKLHKLVESWGSLPPREQARALQEMTQNMSPRHREAIESYFRNIAQASARP